MDFTPDYTKNVAYSPEEWGFKNVADISQPDLSWEFDEYQVWIDREGAVFYAQDAGCSCPTPFESYNEPADRSRLTDRNFDAFRQEVRSWYSGSPVELTRFFAKVMAALANTDDAKLSEEEIVAYEERKAEEERQRKLRQERMTFERGLRKCSVQLSTVEQLGGLVTLSYDNEVRFGKLVQDLQDVPTGALLVLGVYLTRMAEETLKARAEGDPDSTTPTPINP